MKGILVAAVGLGLTVGLVSAQTAPAPKGQPAPAASGLKDLKQQASYALGLDFGRRFKTSDADVDPEVFARGLRDGLTGGQPALTDEQIQQVMQAFTGEIGTRRAQRNKAYLAANKTKPGVVTLPSGLQYKVIKEGTGPSPKATDTVSVHYRGTLVDGTEFDSSIKRGEPTSFPVNRVIPGWTEGLQKMKVGSKYELYIPAELAYGDQPPPSSPIPPDATLVFEVELLKIQ